MSWRRQVAWAFVSQLLLAVLLCLLLSIAGCTWEHAAAIVNVMSAVVCALLLIVLALVHARRRRR